MRAFIKFYLDTDKARREEDDEKGFSLIELIIVVVILGILIAIAVPIFLGLQVQAADNALKTVAANASSAVAADLADDTSTLAAGSVPQAIFTTDDATVVVAKTGSAADLTLDNFCVTATKVDPGPLAQASAPWSSGPGALATGAGCKP
ncbi:MAG: prepilin-type N-terminal cleavage/methylation protein [Rhodococcus erythropolis]|jgi:type IV pilus assembly protein PilA|nr:prepilin-type N-terminal cleavage/methylation protein [Rhodococcus erythropolis]